MKVTTASLLLAVAALVSACTSEKITFDDDVQPLLKAKCYPCHESPNGKGFVASGLSFESYDSLLKGTQYGPVIKPGDPLQSVLLELVEGRADPSIQMPHNKAKLSKEKIEILRRWIEEGAPKQGS